MYSPSTRGLAPSVANESRRRASRGSQSIPSSEMRTVRVGCRSKAPPMIMALRKTSALCSGWRIDRRRISAGSSLLAQPGWIIAGLMPMWSSGTMPSSVAALQTGSKAGELGGMPPAGSDEIRKARLPRSRIRFSSPTASRYGARRSSPGSSSVTRTSTRSHSRPTATARAPSLDASTARTTPSAASAMLRFTSASSSVVSRAPDATSTAAAEAKNVSNGNCEPARQASGPTRLPVRGSSRPPVRRAVTPAGPGGRRRCPARW